MEGKRGRNGEEEMEVEEREEEMEVEEERKKWRWKSACACVETSGRSFVLTDARCFVAVIICGQYLLVIR